MPATKFMMNCGECNRTNYYTAKNRQNNQDKLVLSKFCKHCRSHTEHVEMRLKK